MDPASYSSSLSFVESLHHISNNNNTNENCWLPWFEPRSSCVWSSHSSNHATKPLRPTWGFQSKDFFEQNSLRQFISGDHFCIWKYLEKDKTISSRESLFLVPITSVISAIDNVGTIRSFCDQDLIEKGLRRDHRDICSSVRTHLTFLCSIKLF